MSTPSYRASSCAAVAVTLGAAGERADLSLDGTRRSRHVIKDGRMAHSAATGGK